jgi:hypothetical protein
MARRLRRRFRTPKGYDSEAACRIASTVRRLRPDAAGNLVVVSVLRIDASKRERETDAECYRMRRAAARRRAR